MRGILQTLLWLALITWLGEVVFLSFVVAPTIFRALPRESAGEVLGALFPAYYAIGAAAGAVGLVATMLLRRHGEGRAWWTALALMIATMLAATLYAGVVVQPRAGMLRPALHLPTVAPEVRREFDRLHGEAVALNGAVLLVGLASVAVAVRGSRARPD